MVGGSDERRSEQKTLFANAASASASASASGAGEPIVLEGTVGRIVYQDADRIFSVARFRTDAKEETTIVGELLDTGEGASLRVHGKWIDDRRFGRQFRVAWFEERTPETRAGIERYLSGSKIPGIGPELARRLVDHFGLKTLDVIEREPQRLTEVSGIGAQRAEKLSAAFAQLTRMRRVMVFLLGHGVTASFAARIVKRYGEDAVRVVRENPYRLTEVWGIGFRTADSIAEKLGIARDAPARLQAGLVFVLGEQVEDGHTHVPENVLFDRGAEILGVAREKLLPALETLERGGSVTREVLGDRGRTASLTAVTQLEIEAAEALATLCRTPARMVALDVEQAVSDVEVASNLQLAPQQRKAVTAAAVDKCVVVTGGPGVGKTTIIRAVVEMAARMRRRVALAAPTGRAAKRLAESTGREAITLHRLLEYNPQTGAFQRDEDAPLDADLVVIDECSMVDLALFRALVVALPPRVQLVLVGDIDQLPSVGAGAVLSDVIASGAATVVRLTEIFRQAAQSKIVTSAHLINQGEVPDLDAAASSTSSSSGAGASDFYFVSRDEAVAARDTVVEMVAERIPARFGFDRMTGVQVLAPMHRGELGTTALNVALQARLNPPGDDKPELSRGERAFRLGDKVMQLKNDYDRNVYNGDIGIVERVDPGAAKLWVALGDGRTAEYERADLDQLVLAYAVSIHKSQGSEYPAVVIPLATQHFMMLGRSLLYTAVTRGKRLVVIVGSRRAVGMAVRNATARARYTWLAERIREALEGEPAGASADPAEDVDDIDL
jgi:exodeoxyribonuclease V alpha subunit